MSDSRLPQRWTASPRPANMPGSVHEIPTLPESESTLKAVVQFVALLRRHWVLVFAITAASVAILFYRIRNEQRIYRATAVIRLTDKGQNLSGGISRMPPSQPYRPYTDPVLSQVQVIQSRAVAESVAEREGLRLRALPRWLPPNWAMNVRIAPTAAIDTLHVDFQDDGLVIAAANGPIRVGYGQPVNVQGVAFTVPRRPSVRSADLSLLALSDAANEVRSSVTARARERTDVIDVSYTAPDPELARRVANAIVRMFRDMNAAGAKQESVLRREFIEQQLEKVEALLADARSAHNAFRSREKVFSSQDKFRSEQADLSTIEMRRQELLADKGTYTALLGELATSRSNGTSSSARLSSLAAAPGIAANPVVAQLFAQLVAYQSAHDSMTTGKLAASNPDVIRIDALIASTQRKVEDAVRANIGVIDARVAALDTMKGQLSAGISKLPTAEASEAALVAQVTTYSRQVDLLRDQLQSAQIAEAAEAGQVEIVDLASASGIPIGTGRKPKLILALLLGLALGSTVAYVLENHRPVIRRRDELEESLALPNLALVPQIRRTNGGNRLLEAARHFRPTNGNGKATSQTELVTLSDTRSGGAEAYRTLRTNLLFSAAVHALNRIVITSPGPEEGKSTTAANLAIAFAQQGHRVLLIDCDLRRARIHRIFDETNMPGLTSVLVGGDTLAEAIRPTRIEGLMILPSGALPPNPAELLGSAQMRALLEKLSESYDLLILDTPPLLAASDAAIVSRMTDGALVVVRAGRTERSAVQAAVQQLSTVGARVLGTVLNDPDAEVPKYARYYGYYYNNYYEYPNETSAKA
jgi:succinoglycan biosynthesis transport protein ExoP